MEEKKKLKGNKCNTKRKLIIGSILVMVICSIYGIVQRAFAYETHQWSGNFNYSQSEWFYSTKSYAVVTCEKYGYSKKLWANEDNNGFHREEKNGVTELTLVGDELIPYLIDKCGWTKLQPGDKILWRADARVTVGYSKVTSKRFETVEEAYEENDTDRTDEKNSLKAEYPEITFPDWDTYGALVVKLTDDSGKPVGLCHYFNDNGYWEQLKDGNEYEVEPDDYSGFSPTTHTATVNLESTDGVSLGSDTYAVDNGNTFTYPAAGTIVSDDKTYTYVSATWTMGGKNGTATSTTVKVSNCTADVTITCIYEEDIEEDETCEHVFGEWTTVVAGKGGTCRQTCILCGYEADAKYHYWVETNKETLSSDNEGNSVVKYTYTCQKPEGGCGDVRTEEKAKHTCKWLEWDPWYPTVEQVDYFRKQIAAGETYKTLGWAHNPEKGHWRICEYCEEAQKVTYGHSYATEFTNEGNGYMVKRCKECGWIKEWTPVVVTLTLDANGGTFPNGETVIKLENIEYGSITSYGLLGGYYYPGNGNKEFSGFAYFTGGEGYMYTADNVNKQCVGAAEFFEPSGNGSYITKLPYDYTVYAQWREPSYTVEYKPNLSEVKGSTISSLHKVGEEKSLNTNGFYLTSRITYENGGVSCTVDTSLANTQITAAFAGWSAEKVTRNQNAEVANFADVEYIDGAKVKNLLNASGTFTLYTCWDYKYIYLPNATATDGGSKLSGWKDEEGVIHTVLSNGNYTPVKYYLKGGNETLTAVWIPNAYKVSFDSDGGIFSNGTTEHAPIYVVYNGKYGKDMNGNSQSFPTVEKEGYTFRGWYYKVDNETKTETSTVKYAQDHTLTARWEPDNVKINLDYNFNFVSGATNTVKDKNNVFGSNKDSFERMFGVLYGILPTPGMDDYNFVGWYLEEDKDGNGCGHQECLVTSSGTRVTNPEEHTLHARWIKDKQKVNLDYNYDYSVKDE